MIVGLTGPNAAGKGVVAEMLERRGFEVHSLSDVVREEARSRGLGVDRDTLIRIGQELRCEGGPAVLADRILARLPEKAAVDSIRHPAEVRALRRRRDFYLLGIDAPVELRWSRARERGRPGDDAGLETFRANEERENADRPESQQLRATLRLADVVLSNEGLLESLEGELDELLDRWGRGRDIPEPDPGPAGPSPTA